MQRRDFVESMATGFAGALGTMYWSRLTAVSAAAAAIPETAPYEFLTAHQARLLDVITAHLIPTDDTPGAREAKVVRFIDHSLATILKDMQKDFTATLAAFEEFTSRYRPDGATFLELTPNEQIDAIGELERLKPEVFWDLRGAAMAGMFSHPEHGGNFRKVGWKLIGYEDRYSWVPPFGYYDRGRE
jgi:gluconate 2-dehydrogenase gamma chain